MKQNILKNGLIIKNILHIKYAFNEILKSALNPVLNHLYQDKIINLLLYYQNV